MRRWRVGGQGASEDPTFELRTGGYDEQVWASRPGRWTVSVAALKGDRLGVFTWQQEGRWGCRELSQESAGRCHRDGARHVGLCRSWNGFGYYYSKCDQKLSNKGSDVISYVLNGSLWFSDAQLGQLCPQRTLCSVWTHYIVTWAGTAGIQRIEARDAAEHPTKHGIAVHNKGSSRQNVSRMEVEKPSCGWWVKDRL